MKVAAKLVSVLILGITVLLIVDGYLLIRREVTRFEADMTRQARELGGTLRDLVALVWKTDGREQALKRIEAASREHHVNVCWVWLDAEAGTPYSPAVPSDRLEGLSRGQVVSVKNVGRSGVKQLYTYVLVPLAGERPGALEISESLSQLDGQTQRTITRMLLLTGGVVLFSVVLVGLLGFGMIGRPLQRLIAKARRVGEGDLTSPLSTRGHDELTELARAFNTMCEQLSEAQETARAETEARIAALEQLRHEDRLRTVGRLASGIAHELGTPLNVVSGRAGLIAAGRMSPGENVESANIIKAQAERMTRIIQQLLDFARRRAPHRTSVDLEQVARQTIDVLDSLSKKRNISVSLLKENGGATVLVDTGQIQQVLMNLIVNALDATARGGTVTVGIRRQDARPPEGHDGSAAEYLCLYVEDDGEGISAENIDHVFEPFFTTKDVGEGTGLGLSIAYGIVREHGGWIDVSSQEGSGTRFSVYLPQEVVKCADGC